MNLYYAIWADAINYERIKNGGGDSWGVFTFSYMTVLLSLNLATLLGFIQFLVGYDLNEFTINISKYLSFISNQSIMNMLWAIVNLFIPSMVINYFLVFYKKKYEYILSNYKFRNGRILLIYFSLSVITLLGVSLLNKFLGSFSEMI